MTIFVPHFCTCSERFNSLSIKWGWDVIGVFIIWADVVSSRGATRSRVIIPTLFQTKWEGEQTPTGFPWWLLPVFKLSVINDFVSLIDEVSEAVTMVEVGLVQPSISKLHRLTLLYIEPLEPFEYLSVLSPLISLNCVLSGFLWINQWLIAFNSFILSAQVRKLFL